MLKIGDSIGGIYQVTSNGAKQWRLIESKINKIVELKSGKKYYTKDNFKPLFTEEVDDNTEIQEKAEGYIITKECFGLNEITRPKAENWVQWANENMDQAVGVLQSYINRRE